MALRGYGQFCGFARAVEIVGERWAFLIVRNLLVGPRRFTDLHRGLPGIPTNVLTARLKELEDDGVVRRTVLPRPSGSIVYELTAYGRELHGVVVALGRWGAKSLGEPREREVITADSIRMALMSTLVARAAKGTPISFELRLGPVVVWAKIANGKIVTGEGELPKADAVIAVGPVMRALMARERAVATAIADGSLKLVRGRRAALDRFVELFEIAPLPADDAAPPARLPKSASG